jgi:hypothetical protein
MSDAIVAKYNIFDLIHDQQRRGDTTLALSFWQIFVEEIKTIASNLKGFGGTNYLALSYPEPERVGRWPEVPDTLSVTCDFFKFSATLDPISHTVPSFEHEVIRISSGTVTVSQEGSTYRVVSRPPLEDIDLDDLTLDYDTFWETPVRFAHWACASVVLRDARAKHLRKVTTELG